MNKQLCPRVEAAPEAGAKKAEQGACDADNFPSPPHKRIGFAQGASPRRTDWVGVEYQPGCSACIRGTPGWYARSRRAAPRSGAPASSSAHLSAPHFSRLLFGRREAAPLGNNADLASAAICRNGTLLFVAYGRRTRVPIRKTDIWRRFTLDWVTHCRFGTRKGYYRPACVPLSSAKFGQRLHPPQSTGWEH